MLSQKNLLVIICATSGSQEDVAPEIEKALKKSQISYDLKKVKTPPEVTRLIKKESARFQVIAVYGGDGSITEAIKVLADSKTRLLILPGGTNNAIAKEFNMAVSALENIKMYIDGRYTTQMYDLASVGGELFSLSMYTGWWEQATKETPREQKKRLGAIAYGIGALKAYKKTEKQTYELVVNGKTVKKQAYAMLIANRGAQVLLGLKLFSKKHRAGVLRVALIINPTPVRFAIWLVGRVFGRNNLGGLIKTYRANKITIKKSSKQFIFDDSEKTLELPTEIKGAQHQTKLIVPVEVVKKSLLSKSVFIVELLYVRLKERIRNAYTGTPSYYISQVAPYVYLGGQYRPSAYKQFKEWGITGVINMRTAEPAPAPKGFEILHLKTKDWDPPEVDDLQKGVEFANERINKGEGVYIHCRQGEGRGPTMAAAYLISQGLSLEEALAHIEKSRPMARPNRKQIKRLAEFFDRGKIGISK